MAVGLHSAMVLISRARQLGRTLKAAKTEMEAVRLCVPLGTRSVDTVSVGCEAALIEIAESQIDDYRNGMLIGTLIIILAAVGLGLSMLVLSSI